ncbi:MAG: hypothetical protein H0V30_00655 [Chitinophagaceae bacterium]|jgi:hypothetical protein|nr:hypothetical protein [Chitinophagaceae bacterium]
MKKSVILFFLHLAFSFQGFTQKDSSFALITSIQGDIQQFTVDNMDNLYILSSTDQLKKLDAHGDSIAVYNNVKRYGKLSTIDVSNPLKILLYYKDYNSIVILDRLLNVRHTIDLRKHGIYQVSAIGQSYDGKVWIYDALENKLKKINEEGKLLLETPDFRQLFEEAPQPQQIFDQDGLVYLYDSIRGFFVFDYYGTLKNRIPYTGWQNIAVTSGYIIATKDNRLQRYQVNSFALKDDEIPKHFLPYDHMLFTGSKIYAQSQNLIRIFKLPE